MYEELVKRLRYENMSVLQMCDLMDEAADAIEELSRDLDSMNDANIALYGALPKWIPVTERLPKKAGTYIICDCYGRVCSRHFCKSANAFSGYWHFNGSKLYGNPTHWMPLPEPPKEEA